MDRTTKNRKFSRVFVGASVGLLGMCALPGVGRAQQPAPPAPAQSSPAPTDDAMRSGSVIRRESKLVLIDAVVTDKKGNYVRDLTQNDFKVYEDNKEQPVTSFSAGYIADTRTEQQSETLPRPFLRQLFHATSGPDVSARGGD